MLQINDGTPGSILAAIGKNLRIIRNKRDEKLNSVACSIGVTHPVISKIENGRYNSLSVKLLLKILDYYQVPFEAFLLMNISTLRQSSDYCKL